MNIPGQDDEHKAAAPRSAAGNDKIEVLFHCVFCSHHGINIQSYYNTFRNLAVVFNSPVAQ